MYLKAGEPSRAAEELARLRDRGVRLQEQNLLEDAAKSWLQAREQASQGDFAQAIDTNGDTILDARASRAIFATVAAALESCRTGRPVEVS